MSDLDLSWLDARLVHLQRPATSGPSTGLSRAIAARAGIDVLLVRLAFVLLAICGGVGIVAYAWGTALTPGSSGGRPIDDLMPGFRDWTPSTQKLVVILTSIGAVALIGWATPLPWGVGLLLVAALAFTRHSRNRTSTHSFAPDAAVDALSDDHLVAQWRRDVSAAAGPPVLSPELPVVDLYTDDDLYPEDTAPAVRPATGWSGAFVIVTAMLASGAVAGIVLGLTPTLTTVVITLVGSVAALGYALLRRGRRLPRLFLALLVPSIVVTGYLATQVAATPAAESTPTVQIIGSAQVVDLTTDEWRDVDSVRIDALASDVTLIVPGAAADVSVNDWLSEVTVASQSGESGDATLHVHLDARLSQVTITESS